MTIQSPPPPVLLDASRASWQRFVEDLTEFAALGAQGGAFAHVRPPVRCFREAARVVRDLDLAERVELVEREAQTPTGCALPGPGRARRADRARRNPTRAVPVTSRPSAASELSIR